MVRRNKPANNNGNGKNDKDKPRLTPKQKLFVYHYLQHFNGAKAARQAGYSTNSADAIACENLTKPNIREYITEKVNDMLNDKDELISKVIEETARMALVDIKEYADEEGNLVGDLRNIDTRPINSIKTITRTDNNGNVTIQREFRLHDKLRAVEALGRYVGLGSTLELAGKGGGKIELVVSSDFLPDGVLDESQADNS